MNQNAARPPKPLLAEMSRTGAVALAVPGATYANVLGPLCDALRVHVLVLDVAGRIVDRRGPLDAREHDGYDTARSSGSLFFDVCDRVTGCAAVRQQVCAGVRRVLMGREPEFIIEFEAEGAGRERWRSLRARRIDAGVPRALVTIQDVSERRSAELALERIQRRYALATSAGSVGVWDLNLETGEIFVDTTLKSLIGYLDREIVDTLEAWSRYVHPDDLALVAARLQEHMDGKTPFYEVEHRMLHRDGGVRWFLARGMLIERRKGRPVRVVGTTMDITERKASEEALRASRVSSRRRKREIRRLAIQLMFAQEAERRRIGQELHDDICQRIAALEIMVSDVLRRCGPAAVETLEEARTRLSQLAADVRRLSHDMNPPDLGAGQLVLRLRAHVEELSRLAQLRVHLEVRDVPANISTDVALCLYRIVQEALRNVARHAGTRTAEVELRRDAEGVRLEVIDEGCGFDVAEPAMAGFGLTSMKNRIHRLLGRFEIASAPGRGTRISAWLPVKRP